ncbi:phospho-sugar mutase [Allonocardiopsis opalescens]|uniref:Phosphomannomutase n=1 Tax=Allonocardiopsis opalescens TaxID=1144618 RepID=A0A2T0PSF9_9ACTN|nr:phospho-sugar mutase [Allonocardiopsis opalescens]PRX91829.1 phosphomannomutase [Allonocardiopsis opalescens]
MADSHRSQAEEWLAQDPDPDTRAELTALLERAGKDGSVDGDAAAARAELADRFGSRLEFGTAGLRGAMGAGPNRMNRVTVMRAAAGLASWLGPGRTVVIGYDARHKSDVFARDTAEVLTGAGLRALLLPRPMPTPLLAFAVRDTGADAGVMVTASHNPPQDNGYKVYLRGEYDGGRYDGSQIVPPVDAEISAAIDAVGPVGSLPLGDGGELLDEGVLERYLDAVTALPLGPARAVGVVYTPMHGVGGETLLAAFARAGFPPPAVVAEQAEPDPDFPTVAFPNPEEPGALDLALAQGTRTGADLIIANDPDADRCAVALPAEGRHLTGDEVGALLAEHVLRNTAGADRLVVTSIVSSSILARIAAAHGVHHAETLTGFKWLARAGGPGERNIYGYEEALGYCVGSDGGRPVHDKDGISAALAVAGLAAEARRGGRTLRDLLDEQAAAYGVHATEQLSVRVERLAEIAAAMRRLRAEPPAELAERAVVRAEDFGEGGVDGLPPSDVLRYRLNGPGSTARVIVRPSGTEPKLKCYLEVVRPVDPAEGVAAARARAADELAALRAAVTALLGLGAAGA